MQISKIKLTVFAFLAAMNGLLIHHAYSSDSVPTFSPEANYEYFYTENPCTDQEIWAFGKSVPSSWKIKFAKPFSETKNSIDYLFLAETLKTSAKSEEMKRFAYYWLARNYYNLKLYHLAYESFVETVIKSDITSTRGSLLASLECLNKIGQKYASFQLTTDALDALIKLPIEQFSDYTKNNYYEILARNARKRLAKEDRDPITERVIKKLPETSEARYFLELLVAVNEAKDKDIIKKADLFIKAVGSSGPYKNHLDTAQLLRAQAYYNLHQYKEAIKAFMGVKNSSNLFVQALIGKAWSNLMAGEYVDSTSAAYNFFSGPLKKTFAPDAHAVIAISFTETCNYPEAIESLELFKKTYAHAHRWLYDWQIKQKSSQQNLYKMLTDYLSKKSKVPEQIASEWVRSPIFISGQEELNLILDEIPELKKTDSIIQKKGASEKKDKYYRLAANRIDQQLKGNIKFLTQKEKPILKRINSDLTSRTVYMIKNLADALDNAKRIEAEVYAGLGEKMIVEQALNETGAKLDQKKNTQNKTDAVWDWGRFPTQAYDENEDQVEIWLDEVGFLKTDLENKCKN